MIVWWEVCEAGGGGVFSCRRRLEDLRLVAEEFDSLD